MKSAKLKSASNGIAIARRPDDDFHSLWRKTSAAFYRSGSSDYSFLSFSATMSQ